MMTKPRSGALILSLVSWLVFVSSAFCSDITGAVIDNQGKPVPGAQIAIVNSGGNVVGHATTDKAGQYCVTGLNPGVYTGNVTPPADTTLKAGTMTASLTTEGLTDNWSLSPTVAAIASTNHPGVCDPPDPPAPITDTDVLIGVTSYAVATGIGLGVACAEDDLGCGGGGAAHAPASGSL